MRACQMCEQRHRDPERWKVEEAMRALADYPAGSAPSCYHGCEARWHFDNQGLVFWYRLACAHVCERPCEANNHRCCLCRGLTAPGGGRLARIEIG
jgi:hypothetical protein